MPTIIRVAPYSALSGIKTVISPEPHWVVYLSSGLTTVLVC